MAINKKFPVWKWHSSGGESKGQRDRISQNHECCIDGN